MLLLILVCPVAFLYTHLLHSLFSYALDCIFTCYRLTLGHLGSDGGTDGSVCLRLQANFFCMGYHVSF